MLAFSASQLQDIAERKRDAFLARLRQDVMASPGLAGVPLQQARERVDLALQECPAWDMVTEEQITLFVHLAVAFPPPAQRARDYPWFDLLLADRRTGDDRLRALYGAVVATP